MKPPFSAADGSAGLASALELPELFGELPEAWASAYDPRAPWALLGEPLEAFLAALPSEAIESRPAPDVHLTGDRISIGRGTRIGPGTIIEGPVWIGSDVEIRPGAYIRGGSWIGDGVIVGASTEVKHSILLPGARAPHLNYVGDSILGARANLGAGTILSNFRHDGSEVRIPTDAEGGPISTGRRKLGAILGDGVATGCNCVLHPGAVVGRGTHLYPGVHLRPGLYPAASIIKLTQQLQTVTRR